MPVPRHEAERLFVLILETHTLDTLQPLSGSMELADSYCSESITVPRTFLLGHHSADCNAKRASGHWCSLLREQVTLPNHCPRRFEPLPALPFQSPRTQHQLPSRRRDRSGRCGGAINRWATPGTIRPLNDAASFSTASVFLPSLIRKGSSITTR